MSRPQRITRRQFARRTAAAVASLTIVPRHVLGGPGQLPPSDTLTKAVIGVGGMGRAHLRYPGAVLRAVCDVDRAHLASALEMAGPGVAGYGDFREVLERPDIPSHTNDSERDIRDHVQKQKISGGTRSGLGRQCRDTFSSLKKTCRRLGISYWDYLADRIHCSDRIPSLHHILEQRLTSA